MVDQEIIAPLEGLLIALRFLEKVGSSGFRFRVVKPPAQDKRVGKALGQSQLPADRLLDLLGLKQREVLCIGPAEMGFSFIQDNPADQDSREQCHQAGQKQGQQGFGSQSEGQDGTHLLPTFAAYIFQVKEEEFLSCYSTASRLSPFTLLFKKTLLIHGALILIEVVENLSAQM